MSGNAEKDPSKDVINLDGADSWTEIFEGGGTEVLADFSREIFVDVSSGVGIAGKAFFGKVGGSSTTTGAGVFTINLDGGKTGSFPAGRSAKCNGYSCFPVTGCIIADIGIVGDEGTHMN